MLAYIVWYLGLAVFAVAVVSTVVAGVASVLEKQLVEEWAKLVSMVAWIVLALMMVSGMFVWALLNPFKW